MTLKAQDITQALRELGDPAIAEHSQRFFKTGKGEYGEGDRFLGIRVPALRREAKRFKELSLSETKKLLRSPLHEIRLCALLILVEHFRKGNSRVRADVYRCYLDNTRYINNWDLVDGSAPQIVGGYLQDRSRRPLYRLAGSADLWERRIAVMATLTFIKNRDFEDILALAERLLADDEDLIHKAVGWMLREVGNRDRPAEEAFLERHYERMPRTMLRYAIEKFPERRRQQYLKGRL